MALQFCVAEVNLTLKVDFRGPILKVDCRGCPQGYLGYLGARYVPYGVITGTLDWGAFQVGDILGGATELGVLLFLLTDC